MAEELRMALVDVLRKAGVERADFLPEGVRVLAQELMELELSEQLGAERHERTPERTGSQ
jgi:transposase-like protein